MNRIISFIVSVVLVIPAIYASQPMELADSAYSAGKYDEAAALYLKIAADNGTSAPLLYNLGNTYYRMGKPGMAILYYERALRIDPTMNDAHTNLNFVNSRITDRPGERGTFIGNALDSAAMSVGTDCWAYVAILAFAITIGGVLLYMFNSNVALRKTGFFGAIALLCVFGTALFFSLRGASIATSESEAIIISPSTILSTSPRIPVSRDEEAMLLHEGTKVTILDSIKSTRDSITTLWLDVQVDNVHRAWLNAADAARI